MIDLMEADLLHGSLDQLSPYKTHIRNPMKIHQPFISKPYEIFFPSVIPSTGLLQAPPLSLRHSYPPYSLQPPPQPPLLPLPPAHLRRSSFSQGPSWFPANRNGNRTRDHSFTPKKSKSPTKIPKKEEKKAPKRSSDTVIVSSTSDLGSDPKELPKNIVKVSHFDSMVNTYSNDNSVIGSSSGHLKAVEDRAVDMLPDSVLFTVSPPPSSLPLPTFSLRPKLSCNAVAAGIDAGATDNLRRLLRLQ